MKRPSISEHLLVIRSPLIVFFLSVAALAGLALWIHLQLPEQVAVHFNGSGEPDGWGPRWMLTGVTLGVIALFVVVFGLVAIFIPLLPNKLWNFPHKAHWLGPERRAETVGRFCRDYLGMGVLMMAFMAWVTWDTFLANTSAAREGRLAMGLWDVGIFMLVFFGYTAWMVIRYYRVPREAVADSESGSASS